MNTIEINQDLTDLNFFLLNKKAVELWEFQKQQSEMCENCDRTDFTSDLMKRNPVFQEVEINIDHPPLPKPRGFWYEGIWMELEDGETVEGALEEIKDAIKHEHAEEVMTRIQECDLKAYKVDIEAWKDWGWVFDNQPVNPVTGELRYAEWRCIEEQEKCKYRYSCDRYPDSCYEKDDFEKCGKYEPQFT